MGESSVIVYSYRYRMTKCYRHIRRSVDVWLLGDVTEVDLRVTLPPS